MITESEEKYKAFLSSLYKDLQEEELFEAEMPEDEISPLFEKTVVKPDFDIVFPNKSFLKKPESEAKVFRLRSYVSPVMSMAAMLLMALLMQSQLPSVSGASYSRPSEDEKMQADFPVMDAPLSSSSNEDNFNFSPHRNNYYKRNNIVTGSAIHLIEKDGMSNDAFVVIKRKLLQNKSVSLNNSEEEYYRVSEAKTKILMDEPLSTSTGKYIPKGSSIRSMNNLDKDNMYSLKVAVLKW